MIARAEARGLPVTRPRVLWNVDRGVSNLGNKGYQLSDGYPMPGRGYYLNVGYRF